MGKLDGKVAIITGGARGQGAAHARTFVGEGAKVVITDVLVDPGQALAKELGDGSIFVEHDVTSESDWQRVVTETDGAFGPPNVLVNNAGIFVTEPIEAMTRESYQKVIDVNQLSIFLGMRAVLPLMRRAGGGSIVNIASIGGVGGSPNALAYVASKFAVRGMTKVAALEFADDGIRVNAVLPGSVLTPMIQQDSTSDQAAVDQVVQSVPLKRIGDPEEVSKLVLFLASDDSSYSTGADFVIDGGVTASV